MTTTKTIRQRMAAATARFQEPGDATTIMWLACREHRNEAFSFPISERDRYLDAGIENLEEMGLIHTLETADNRLHIKATAKGIHAFDKMLG